MFSVLVGLAFGSDVRINEVLVNPPGSDSSAQAEWIELLNVSDDAVDLSGWSIERAKSSSYSRVAELPDGLVLEAGAYLVVGELKAVVSDVSVPQLDLGQGSDGDGVALVRADGVQEDVVVYSTTRDEAVCDLSLGVNAQGISDGVGVPDCVVFGPSEGFSVGRLPDGQDTDDAATDFAELASPTPGLANDTKLPDCGAMGGVVINELLPDHQDDVSGSDEGREWIELYHSGTAEIDLTGWEVRAGTSPPAKALVVLDDVVLYPGDFLLVGGSAVEGVDVVWDDSKSLGNGGDADGVVLADCAGYVADTVIYSAPNAAGWLNDLGELAESFAPEPLPGASLARLEDGLDTDRSGDDFVVAIEPTPGESNPVVEPVVCVAGTEGLVINEVLVNPSGSDDGLEWFELYNASDATASLSGWGLTFVLKPDDLDGVDVVFPAGTELTSGSFLVIGGEDAVVSVNLRIPNIPTAGNGTGGDAVALVDCEGVVIDRVVYGSDNEDGLLDDQGIFAEPVDAPGDEQSIGRFEDGVDTDEVSDWRLFALPTPGETNALAAGGGGGADVGPKGCGCGSDGLSQDPDLPQDPSAGCSTVPSRLPLMGWLALFLVRRRQG
jgi:hypothetical protein